MKQTPQDKKSGCVVIVIAILVFGFIYDKLGCNTESNNKNETQTETAKNVVPSMTDEGYLKYFQEKWDAVKLEKEGKFPQYDHYQTSLNNILQEMLTVLEKDPSFKYDSPSKLNKLRLKFIDSKKMKTAISNYLTYGEPMSSYALHAPCEDFLQQNANDPSSIDIEGYNIQQSKRGWKVLVKYRGKNAFGGLVLNVINCDVRFNPSERTYYVVSGK